MFTTLVFHEIRPKAEISKGQRPICVADGYEDCLPMPLYNSTDYFHELMTYLKGAGYHFLSLDEIKGFYYNDQTLPEKSALISFDDCYQSQKKYAYPILKEMGIPAVSFVPSGWVFNKEDAYREEYSQVLSFKELEEMSDVFTYANHTHHFHQREGMQKSRIMWETEATFVQDLKECNQYVEEQDVFAYPFGMYDQSNVKTLADLNFKLAFTTKPGFNTKKTPPLELHRNIVSEGLPIEKIRELLGE
ncbi:polysaccharide deacetylase family protein [Alkalibacterium kapii]|uniref:NodB homology domain-containing protein n=1 Tax=Alkalibacterium kapii TaxID=426704 RepID=A0A511AU54_9LACT|nr:polysaccharide deacetylase family protein [Alkalibacterium kapii]GEK91242.1 hypothetical protein AKA01nite_08640 [Alkalibacterium kapii]